MKCCHVSEKEGWWLVLLHQFPMPEHPYEEGFLPIAQNTRGVREPSRCQSLFLPGSEIWILADKDGRSIKAVHRLHCG